MRRRDYEVDLLRCVCLFLLDVCFCFGKLWTFAYQASIGRLIVYIAEILLVRLV